ncbi:MAG: cytochrome c maturation protein CcmE [Gaiellales bacterium]
MGTPRFRLVISLAVASLLATFLVYTTVFSGSTQVMQVGQLTSDPSAGAKTVRLNGWVARESGNPASPKGLRFTLADNQGARGCVHVLYYGSRPDAFRTGRSVLVDGKLEDGTFVAVKDSLSTRCPSKYTASQKAISQPSSPCSA